MRFPWQGPKKTDPEEQHDLYALNSMMIMMRNRMAKKRREGRGGWWDSRECTVHDLARQLIAVIEKGNPVDVANYCMMLHHRNGGQQALKMAWMLHMGEATQRAKRDELRTAGMLTFAAGGEIKVFPRHLHELQNIELTTYSMEDPPCQVYSTKAKS